MTLKNDIPIKNGLLWGLGKWTMAIDEKIHVLDLPGQCCLKDKDSGPLPFMVSKTDAVELDTRIGESILAMLRKKNKYSCHKIS